MVMRTLVNVGGFFESYCLYVFMYVLLYELMCTAFTHLLVYLTCWKKYSIIQIIIKTQQNNNSLAPTAKKYANKYMGLRNIFTT